MAHQGIEPCWSETTVLQTAWNTSSSYTPSQIQSLYPRAHRLQRVTTDPRLPWGLPYPAFALAADEVELVRSELQSRWVCPVRSFRGSRVLLDCSVYDTLASVCFGVKPLTRIELVPIGLEDQWLRPEARARRVISMFEAYPYLVKQEEPPFREAPGATRL